jgi:glycosyltransferase involved in cell wall biosynthesis
MINGKRIAVVMPAYNAARTVEATVRDLPDTVDERILVDDCSADETVAAARRLGLTVVVHDRNRGYGANQKTCYAAALAAGADVVVMIHPDYQYCPLLVTAMASMVAYGIYDLVLGSRILGGQARSGGMPVYKYVSNRLLTAFENFLLGAKLSEYHTGLRAYGRDLLLSLPLADNSDDFVFDNQVIADALLLKARIGEVSCPTRYFPEASSINFRRSVRYGLGVVRTTFECFLTQHGIPLGRYSRRSTAIGSAWTARRAGTWPASSATGLTAGTANKSPIRSAGLAR